VSYFKPGSEANRATKRFGEKIAQILEKVAIAVAKQKNATLLHQTSN
jgi:hypothetical protein